MKKILIALSLLVLAANISPAADEISFTATVSKNTVALNDSFVYVVTIAGPMTNFGDPQIANLSAFNQFSGGKSQSINVINGKVSGSVSYTYTLGPKTVGRFVIEPSKFQYNGKVYTTDSIEINVRPAQSIASQTLAQNQAQTQAAIRARSQADMVRQMQENTVEPNFFVRANVNKKTVYENEKLVYRFSFYTNVNLASNPQYVPPSFNGFFNDGSKPKSHIEEINSMRYLVSEVETTIYPIATGKQVIGAADLKIAVAQISMPSNVNNVDDMMAAFIAMTSGRQIQERQLHSNPIEITVLPLPKEGRPDGFYGAVGKFNIRAEVDRRQINTNEPITLTLRVTGNGNFKSVTRFDIKAEGFKKYDTFISDADESARVFTTLLVPISPGKKTIAPVTLAFFNPDTKRYETVRTEPIEIDVVGQAAPESQTLDRQKFGGINDISYNKQIGKIINYKTELIKNINFYLVFVPFILLLIGGCMFNLFAKSKTKGSISKAYKKIDKAESELQKGNLGGLFDAIYSALVEAISVKMQIETDKLQEKQILENLKELSAPEDAIKRLAVVFERINLYKFAAVRADEKTLTEMLENVKEIIKQLDD
ncbi:MAG: BatD family protein [Elusimicrobiota bacterium]|jgi:hypothetical protein|nr:BatD family protein [Elusimicrobiota bacterium]